LRNDRAASIADLLADDVGASRVNLKSEAGSVGLRSSFEKRISVV
jgi:hypothetical protein